MSLPSFDPRVFAEALLAKLPMMEARAPIFLVPTGPRPDDYVVMFDLEEVNGNLRRGILVRPAFEVWAARTDVDRPTLAQRIEASFNAELDKNSENSAKIFEKRVEEVNAQLRNEASLTDKFLGSVSGLGFEASVTAVIVGLLSISTGLLLIIGLFGVGVIVSLAGDLIRNVRRETELFWDRRLFAQINSLIETKRADVLTALSNLHIRRHHEFARILGLICEVESTEAPTGKVEDGPDPTALINRELITIPEEYRIFFSK